MQQLHDYAQLFGQKLNDAPLREVNRASYVSIRVVHGLLEMVEQSGASAQAILQALKLDLEHYEQDDVLPRSMVYRACELAIEHTHDPALGLHWAMRQGATAFSPISQLLVHAPTLRHALDALSQLHPLFSQQSSFRILESDTEVALQCYRLSGTSSTVRRFVAEMMLAGLYRIVLSFDPLAKARLVSFRHKAPAYSQEYDQVFQRSVCFDQPFTGLVFDRALLHRPSQHNDADVFDALYAIAKLRILRRKSQEPVWQSVRNILIQDAISGNLQMPDVARACNMSTRTLRRRLAAEGKPYPKLLNEARSLVAKELLASESYTIKEIAAMLGFDDRNSFQRAFKRWTGLTPNDFRYVSWWKEEAAKRELAAGNSSSRPLQHARHRT